MSVPGIEGIGAPGFTPFVPATVAPTGPQATQSGQATQQSGQAFGDLVIDGLDRLEAVQDKSDKLAVQAATGDLQDIHDYTLAATEASVTTQLTVAVRNRALEAFNEIMRMPIG
jgi:flagellar hook-basal body complex protein FliE